jgi:branched-chain amino acid transport system ATP-binding protein
VSELLRTESLRRRFGELIAVDGVTLSFEGGILTSIIGPNGAGKTTLINLLTGSLPPDSGKILFKGEDITGIPTEKRVKKGISRSFQIMNIFPRLTVFQNVLLPVFSCLNKSMRSFSSVQDHQDAVAEAERILEDVGLWGKRDLPSGKLSHGDQRLLEMGLAVAAEPELCFLDEPSSGLNPVERVRVLELIKKMATAGKTTFVVVEHDMDVVFSLSDRIIVMSLGRMLAEGEPTEIRENKEVREIYLGEEL